MNIHSIFNDQGAPLNTDIPVSTPINGRSFIKLPDIIKPDMQLKWKTFDHLFDFTDSGGFNETDADACQSSTSSFHGDFYLVEYYDLSLFRGEYGAGRVINTFSLLPGETTEITLSSFKDESSTTQSTSSVFEEVNSDTKSSFQHELDSELSQSNQSQESKSLNAAASGSYSGFGASVSASAGYNQDSSSEREHMSDNVNKALSNHASAASSKRTMQVSTTKSENSQQGSSSTIQRQIQNINNSKTLHFTFRQMLQEYISILHLVDIKVAYIGPTEFHYDNNTGTCRSGRFYDEQPLSLLPKLVKKYTILLDSWEKLWYAGIWKGPGSTYKNDEKVTIIDTTISSEEEAESFVEQFDNTDNPLIIWQFIGPSGPLWCLREQFMYETHDSEDFYSPKNFPLRYRVPMPQPITNEGEIECEGKTFKNLQVDLNRPHGWYDAQGNGYKNDYGRWVMSKTGECQECPYWSVALSNLDASIAKQFTCPGNYSQPEEETLQEVQEGSPLPPMRVRPDEWWKEFTNGGVVQDILEKTRYIMDENEEMKEVLRNMKFPTGLNSTKTVETFNRKHKSTYSEGTNIVVPGYIVSTNTHVLHTDGYAVETSLGEGIALDTYGMDLQLTDIMNRKAETRLTEEKASLLEAQKLGFGDIKDDVEKRIEYLKHINMLEPKYLAHEGFGP